MGIDNEIGPRPEGGMTEDDLSELKLTPAQEEEFRALDARTAGPDDGGKRVYDWKEKGDIPE